MECIRLALYSRIHIRIFQALTVERYISICMPFLRYRFDIKSWYYIVTVVTFSVIYNTPRFFEWMTTSEPIERPCYLSSLYQQGMFHYRSL